MLDETIRWHAIAAYGQLIGVRGTAAIGGRESPCSPRPQHAVWFVPSSFRTVSVDTAYETLHSAIPAE